MLGEYLLTSREGLETTLITAIILSDLAGSAAIAYHVTGGTGSIDRIVARILVQTPYA